MPICSVINQFDHQVLLNELRKIVSSSKFLSSADLQICTGPYVLCHMMQLILDVPLLVYLGGVLSPCSAGQAASAKSIVPEDLKRLSDLLAGGYRCIYYLFMTTNSPRVEEWDKYGLFKCHQFGA